MKNLIILCIVICAACTQTETSKINIAQWRGENRDGIYNETGLLKSWPKAGPDLIWETDTIGHGYGSPVVTSDKVFVNGEIDSVSHLFAFDLTGNLLWASPNGKAFMGEGFSASFPGSRSTPTIVNNLAYAISGLGRVACYETETGAEKWAIDMLADFNGKYNYFGFAESPLVDENRIFCLPAGKDTNIVALDRFTGETLWISKGLSDTASYCSPMIINLPTRKILVTFTIHNLLGLDAATGELLWSHKQKIKQFNQPSNTPIFKDGHLYYVQPDGNGAVKLALADDGTSITEVWAEPSQAGTFTGFVIKDGKIFNTTGKLKMEIRDINSGQITDSLRVKSGSVITADNMIYCYSDNGSVNLINTTDSVNIVSKFKIKKGTKEHFSNPVIKNGVLYIRHGNTLLAYNIKQE
ncbi:MAG: PQQ-like beta-propeller repeat protein [Salinivirgaceae bacterium]|jgi:outer membrane protein assembly factor BamB|nr:PQQ-like beta-propeller repeat protein [Salinivirgaceae bacterium]